MPSLFALAKLPPDMRFAIQFAHCIRKTNYQLVWGSNQTTTGDVFFNDFSKNSICSS
jgi:hypothetical protein